MGKVLKIYSDGDIRVAVADHAWTFNSVVLVKEESTATSTGYDPQSTSQRGQVELQGILQQSTSSSSSSASQQNHHDNLTAEERRQSQQLQTEIGRKLNPLHSNFSIHILLTPLYTFSLVLTRRIPLIIKASLFGDHFLYSLGFDE